MSAEVVSASWLKVAHACLSSCSGIHRVERVERSGKAEGGVSCCSCGGKMVAMRRRLLSFEGVQTGRCRLCSDACMEYKDSRTSLLPCTHYRSFPSMMTLPPPFAL